VCSYLLFVNLVSGDFGGTFYCNRLENFVIYLSPLGVCEFAIVAHFLSRTCLGGARVYVLLLQILVLSSNTKKGEIERTCS
jgi:hypothetical protein